MVVVCYSSDEEEITTHPSFLDNEAAGISPAVFFCSKILNHESKYNQLAKKSAIPMAKMTSNQTLNLKH
ncbi:MAG: hypothetical protein A2W85_03320 [Bacteroidetes bacterium GWF2_41_31]|nr:MAG: hypothetical protein A2W85_03320 [Bacteroidetes bacterium GWF2_41_31]